MKPENEPQTNVNRNDKLIIYKECVSDLIDNDKVKSMSGFIQHRDITCLEHCISVSFYSCSICRFLKLDWRSAARGALLHDLFLYDWHDKDNHEKLHAFSHPSTALKNAGIFVLNDTEKDIIKKHMWPLTIVPPLHRETWIVTFVDKFCALFETFGFFRGSCHYLFLSTCGCTDNI